MSRAIYTAGKGLIWYIAKLVTVIYIIGFLINASASALEIGWDTTDGKSRSGMSLHRDAATGCQYLSTSSGGITPRLSNDGQHMGCKQ